jgi:hypothetical protein
VLASERDTKVKRLAGKIDRVLVDAPCTGFRTLRRNPDLKWRQPESSVAELTAKQSSILAAAATLVKPGGRLVYATCSVLPDENEAIVDAFLAENPDGAGNAAADLRANIALDTDPRCNSFHTATAAMDSSRRCSSVPAESRLSLAWRCAGVAAHARALCPVPFRSRAGHASRLGLPRSRCASGSPVLRPFAGIAPACARATHGACAGFVRIVFPLTAWCCWSWRVSATTDRAPSSSMSRCRCCWRWLRSGWWCTRCASCSSQAWLRASERAIAFDLGRAILYFTGVPRSRRRTGRDSLPVSRSDVAVAGERHARVILTLVVTLWLSGLIEMRLLKATSFDTSTKAVRNSLRRAAGRWRAGRATGDRLRLTLLTVFGGALGVGIGLGLQSRELHCRFHDPSRSLDTPGRSHHR